MSEIEFSLLEFTSAHKEIETPYQNARSLQKRFKNDVELTEHMNSI